MIDIANETDINRDIKMYNQGMINGHWQTCLAIERRHGLEGYPPEIVSTWLAAEATERGSGDAAIDVMTGARCLDSRDNQMDKTITIYWIGRRHGEWAKCWFIFRYWPLPFKKVAKGYLGKTHGQNSVFPV